MKKAAAAIAFGAIGVLGAALGTAQPSAGPGAPADGLAIRQARVDDFNARFRAAHAGASPEQFGLQCCQVTFIPASAFTPLTKDDHWSLRNDDYMSQDSAGPYLNSLWAPVLLPTGVSIQFFDLFYLDLDPTHDIKADLLAHPGGLSTPPPSTLVATASSSGNPGYGFAADSLGYTVDNDVFVSGASLKVVISPGATGLNLAFKGVDLWWVRQVYPAPATPTFTDVPTSHPFFQFIEALAAAGITVGCGGGNFCPDQPLTRKQEAAFIAKALGLYWRY